MQGQRALTVGISGGSGSGKTALAYGLSQFFSHCDACILDQDSYYLDRSHLCESDRCRINFDEPNAVDHVLMSRDLHALARGKPIRKPVYSFEAHARTGATTTVNSAPFILVEGLFIFWHRSLRELIDIKIYIDTPSDLRFIRRAKRDISERGRTIKSVMDQYLSCVRPMHDTYIAPVRKFADVVLVNDDLDRHELVKSALDGIRALVKELPMRRQNLILSANSIK